MPLHTPRGRHRAACRLPAPWLALRGLAAAALLGLFAACHSPERANPMDPYLTSTVTLYAPAVDTLGGSAVLTWTMYRGDQPFAAYEVRRRLVGQRAPDAQYTVEAAAETTFVDRGLEADRAYVYSIAVVNAAGFEVESNTAEVAFELQPSHFREVEFDSRSASASLRWSRSAAGFSQYQLLRQTEADDGPVQLYRTTTIDDTTYVDSGLTGNLDYTYTIVTRSTTGRELVGQSASGSIYRLAGQWDSSVPEAGSILTSACISPDGVLYATVSTGFYYGDAQPELSEADRIYCFAADGQPLGVLAPEPSVSRPLFHATEVAADARGLYVLLRKPESIHTSYAAVGSHLNALTADGRPRYRWPPTGELPNLTGLAMSADGELWVSQGLPGSDPSRDRVRMHRLDPADGGALGAVELAAPGLLLLYPAVLALGGDLGAYGGVSQGTGIVFFDPQTGAALDRDLAGALSDTNIEDLAIGADGRIYLLQSMPIRVEVIRDWRHLTSWSVGQAGAAVQLPAELTLDPSGRLVVVEIGVRTWTYQP
ncbi:MAG: hypothetical protein ABIL09_07840 [Gemmatimonadota bacterium]